LDVDGLSIHRRLSTLDVRATARERRMTQHIVVEQNTYNRLEFLKVKLEQDKGKSVDMNEVVVYLLDEHKKARKK
jgi:hypothetical protein